MRFTYHIAPDKSTAKCGRAYDPSPYTTELPQPLNDCREIRAHKFSHEPYRNAERCRDHIRACRAFQKLIPKQKSPLFRTQYSKRAPECLSFGPVLGRYVPAGILEFFNLNVKRPFVSGLLIVFVKDVHQFLGVDEPSPICALVACAHCSREHDEAFIRSERNRWSKRAFNIEASKRCRINQAGPLFSNRCDRRKVQRPLFKPSRADRTALPLHFIVESCKCHGKGAYEYRGALYSPNWG